VPLLTTGARQSDQSSGRANSFGNSRSRKRKRVIAARETRVNTSTVRGAGQRLPQQHTSRSLLMACRPTSDDVFRPVIQSAAMLMMTDDLMRGAETRVYQLQKSSFREFDA